MQETDFKVGDEVWCVIYGKGKVFSTTDKGEYPIGVKFDSGGNQFYTPDGKYLVRLHNRALYFSEPKIVAEIKRPWEPTLIGKTVAYRLTCETTRTGVIKGETQSCITIEGYGTHYKETFVFVYEIINKNLLKE